MGDVISFDVRFDGTDLQIDEIREEARRRGWPGVHIDMDRFIKTGTLWVYRLTRDAAYGEQPSQQRLVR